MAINKNSRCFCKVGINRLTNYLFRRAATQVTDVTIAESYFLVLVDN